jgi:pSer/pThr/pTyr-binding forkhead associated (FHA) protein
MLKNCDKKNISGKEVNEQVGVPTSRTEVMISPKAKLIGLGNTTSKEDENGLVIELTGPEMIVGRDDNSAVVLNKPGISRRHARLYPVKDTWGVEDLDGTNGVWINGKRATNETLSQGDRVSFGKIHFRFELSSPPPASDRPEDDKTMMFNDSRASEIIIEARAGKEKSVPPPPLPEAKRAKTATTFSKSASEDRSGSAAGRLTRVLRPIVLIVAFIGLVGGGFYYYQNTYKVRKAKETTLKKYSTALEEFTSDYEAYNKRFSKNTHDKQLFELKSLLQQIAPDIRANPELLDLKVLEATFLFLHLERKVRYLLEDKRADEAFALLDRIKRKIDAHYANTKQQARFAERIGQIRDLVELLHIVSKYKVFQEKYPDPHKTSKKYITRQMEEDVSRAKEMKRDYVILKKRNNLLMSVEFRYFHGMINEVDEYYISLVNKWHQFVFYTETNIK